MMKKLRDHFQQLSLKIKLVILICLVFILAATAENIYILHVVNNEHYQNSALQVENVATLVALDKQVIAALADDRPSARAVLQNYAEQMRKLSQTDYIVIMDMQGIRQSHPDSHKLGYRVVGGDTDRVFSGESYLSTAKGTLGVALRYFVPIWQADKQIGAVLVGSTFYKIDNEISRTHQPIIWALIVSLLFAILLALLFSHNLKKILLGFEPSEMARVFEERAAILRTVREGIIVINKIGLLTVVNDEAKKILKIEGRAINPLNHHVDEFIPNTRLYEVMNSGQPEFDCEQNINGAVILTNRTPLFVKGELVGAIASFRDMTEMRELAENLTGVKRYVDALRAQSHEFSNKLHVIYGLAFNHKEQALVEYLNDIMGKQEQEERLITTSIHDPIIASFIKSKYSRARELGVSIHFSVTGNLPLINQSSATHCLVTIIGNLIDNALDAVEFSENKQIDVSFIIENEILEIIVQDHGKGITDELLSHIFAKGYSTKGEHRGFGLYLVLVCIDELNGDIEVNNKQGTCFHVSLPLYALYQEGEQND